MKLIIIFLIDTYKRLISPVFEHFGTTCKYYPSCSEYMKQAVTEYGTFQGICLGTKRVLRCNPFFKGGYDPVNKGGN